MASTRIAVLSVLDGRDRFGLGPETAAAARQGVEVIPITTGIVESSGDDIGIRALRPRLVASALSEALEQELDGMLIGLVPDYWQARSIHRLLLTNLPETIVWAPLSGVPDAGRFLGSYNRRLQLGQLLPEATVAVLPYEGADDLLGESKGSPQEVAAALVENGAHAAWIRSRRSDGRGVDAIRVGSRDHTLDYPRAKEGAAPVATAILAACLALGTELGEALETASREESNLGDLAHVAVRA